MSKQSIPNQPGMIAQSMYDSAYQASETCSEYTLLSAEENAYNHEYMSKAKKEEKKQSLLAFQQKTKS